MYSFQLKSCILVAISLFGVIAVSQSTHNATDAQNTNVPINAVGDIVAVQGVNNAPSMLVYQDSNSGHLVALRVSNAFSVGHPTARTLIIPPEDVLWGTPLAIAQFGQAANTFGNFELFYFTPNNTVAEIAWNGNTGQWLRGANCSPCIDSSVIYRAVPGSRALYAMATTNAQRTAEMVVGFESAEFPGTVSEAQRFNSFWTLNALTNA